MDSERMSDETERLRRRIEELERELQRLDVANRELRRTNARLASGRLVKLDSAAASAQQRGHAARRQVGKRLRGAIRARLRALALRVLR
jgi:cell division septum initiation protein DivIVA